MSLKIIFYVNSSLNRRIQNIFGRRYFATTTDVVDITAADEKPIYDTDLNEQSLTDEEIEKKRNKSGLSTADRNRLYNMKPYNESKEWYHDTIKYKKRLLGRYGMNATEVPLGFAWPSIEEVNDQKEYERVAYPQTVQESWAQFKKEHKEKEEFIRKRDNEIAVKLEKMDYWRAALQAKIAKKENELNAAKAHRENLLEEIRQHFGFKISVHDERFKNMVLAKEEEAKKQKREAKKKDKAAKYLNMMVELSTKQSQSLKDDTNKDK